MNMHSCLPAYIRIPKLHFFQETTEMGDDYDIRGNIKFNLSGFGKR